MVTIIEYKIENQDGSIRLDEVIQDLLTGLRFVPIISSQSNEDKSQQVYLRDGIVARSTMRYSEDVCQLELMFDGMLQSKEANALDDVRGALFNNHDLKCKKTRDNYYKMP